MSAPPPPKPPELRGGGVTDPRASTADVHFFARSMDPEEAADYYAAEYNKLAERYESLQADAAEWHRIAAERGTRMDEIQARAETAEVDLGISHDEYLAAFAETGVLRERAEAAVARADRLETALDVARHAGQAHNWRNRAEAAEALAESYADALQLHKDRIRVLQEALCECPYAESFQADVHDESCPVFTAARAALASPAPAALSPPGTGGQT